jgi:hypothetical protein
MRMELCVWTSKLCKSCLVSLNWPLKTFCYINIRVSVNKGQQHTLNVVRMNQDGEGKDTLTMPVTQDETVLTADGQPEVNLTVEGFFPSSTSTDATPSTADPLNAFMQMDPDQLEKLENALQSEQAKQILGVTMLGTWLNHL